MSNLIKDIEQMHQKYKANQWVYDKLNTDDHESIAKLLDFRMLMLTEEFTETLQAHKIQDAEEVVDGLIDLIVVAIGTLDLFEVDVREAWEQVYKANSAKEVGVKPARPNPLGLPDLIKPEGWTAPDHKDNHGLIDLVYGECFE